MKKIKLLIVCTINCIMLLFWTLYVPIIWLIYCIKLYMWHYYFSEFLESLEEDFVDFTRKLHSFEIKLFKFKVNKTTSEDEEKQVTIN